MPQYKPCTSIYQTAAHLRVPHPSLSDWFEAWYGCSELTCTCNCSVPPQPEPPCYTRPDYELSYEISRINNYKVCSGWFIVRFHSLVQPRNSCQVWPCSKIMPVGRLQRKLGVIAKTFACTWLYLFAPPHPLLAGLAIDPSITHTWAYSLKTGLHSLKTGLPTSLTTYTVHCVNQQNWTYGFLQCGFTLDTLAY